MIFLRFPNEQTFLDIIAPYLDEEGNLILPNIDVIGVIYEGGEYDEEGSVITPPVAIEGWHVNAIEIPDDWQEYVIDKPNKPYRIFAGDFHE